MKMNLEDINVKDHMIFDADGKYRGEIIYEYIRGSHLYGTNNEQSDTDYGGIYIMPEHTLLGLGIEYQTEIKDKKGDTCIWEIGRFMELAMSSNPTVLEALFIPDDKVVYEHPIIRNFRKHREEFISKKCFAPFGGYAISQIKKAQGQNKKIHWDVTKMVRKNPLDFCFTFYKQGPMPMEKWLAKRGMDQRNCGLVNVPNMPDVYGVYYDWGQHFRLADISKRDFLNMEATHPIINYLLTECNYEYDYIMDNYDTERKQMLGCDNFYDDHKTPKGGYCGIISPDGDSNTVRLSSIPSRSELPICLMTYNSNGYQSHCREYIEYTEWKEKRNKARYESNLEGEKSGNPDMMYDCKNMMHCFRLMTMAKEIAEGKGILLDRSGIDREFLLDVRNRKYGYSELMKKMLVLKKEMDEAIEKSEIKDEIDIVAVDRMLIEMRNDFKPTSLG